ncbi:IS110 family transposase [Lentzea sp. NEAU-D7]|uniref:IS110 family transposase n=1 Tax=Lentzea sp. NEAU-D7 TaxID=2994667 RepID=UPI00224B9A2D|nr:transposase [Lentzea sp. NEAU-D7]MCX2952713.1 transposase [Lentzea sp. NEAU-D7]
MSRYRERHTVARPKSDHVDAMTLANILRTDAHAHRPLPAYSDLARAIAVLSRATQDATWRRTRATQELRAVLREYYPGFLAAFTKGTVTNLASPEARAVLQLAPTPAAAARVTKAQLAAALPGRPQARHRRARNTSAPRPARPAAPAASGGRGRLRPPGPRAARQPQRRMRRRRPARRRHRHSVPAAPRLGSGLGARRVWPSRRRHRGIPWRLGGRSSPCGG